MGKKLPKEMVKIPANYCYICNKRFFLMCGAPQVKIGGCCSGFYFDGCRYITPVYAHLDCFIKHTSKIRLLSEKRFIELVTKYCTQNIDHLQICIKTARSDNYKGMEENIKNWKDEIKEYKSYLKIMKPKGPHY